MNIGLLTDKYPPDPGGLAISTRRLARGLTQAGHTVRVSVPSAALAPGTVITSDDDGVNVQRIGAHRRADDALSGWFDHITAQHTTQPFDVLHAMYITSPAFVAVAAGHYLGVPSVISARGNDLDRAAFDPGKFAQVAYALQHANAVTAVTTDLARKARALAPGIEPRWVPNGVDTILFSGGQRATKLPTSGIGPQPVIAFVGEARQKKGLTILLPAFAQVSEKLACPSTYGSDPLSETGKSQPPALFLIGGVRQDDAPILDVFRRQNPTLDVRVVPNMPHEQLPAYYHVADVLVLPSLRDGLPNALLEGMACECTVVASCVGGMLDAVRHRENGWLVPPGDVDALANALFELLNAPDLRAQLGRAARATVEMHFTPAKELESNLEIYRSVKREA